RALFPVVAARAPDVGPISLDVLQLDVRKQLFKRIDGHIVGIDAHPQLEQHALIALHAFEARFDAQGKQQDRMAVVETPDVYAWIGKLREVCQETCFESLEPR